MSLTSMQHHCQQADARWQQGMTLALSNFLSIQLRLVTHSAVCLHLDNIIKDSWTIASQREFFTTQHNFSAACLFLCLLQYNKNGHVNLYISVGRRERMPNSRNIWVTVPMWPTSGGRTMMATWCQWVVQTLQSWSGTIWCQVLTAEATVMTQTPTLRKKEVSHSLWYKAQ